eukprot:Em0001g2430a
MQAPMPTSIYHPPSHNLKQSQFLFVLRDAHHTPFQRPYEEPFKVMQAGDKTFTTDRGGQKEFISVDRALMANVDLKSAFCMVPVRPDDWNLLGRQPLTIKMLKELSQSLYVSKTHSTHDRLMLQAALAVAFFGFLRVSKFTVNSWKRKAMRRGRFLAKQDVLLAPYDLQLTIKYSKMDQLGKGSIITMGLTRSSLLSSPRHAILLKVLSCQASCSVNNLCWPLWYNGSHPICPTMVPLQAISIFNRK